MPMRSALLTLSISALTSLLTLSPAAAQTAGSFSDNLYLSASIGAGFFNDDMSYTDTGVGGIMEDFDIGLQTQGALGYRFTERFRAEAEFFYRRNESDTISVNGAGLNASNTFTSLGGMINGYVDMPNGDFVPYVGAGIGIVNHDLDSFENGTGTSGGLDDIEFAYQFMLGSNYRINQKIDLFGEYRLFGSTDPSVDTSDGSSVEVDYQTHNFLMGLRYNF